jgi:hypothetical protein
MQPRGCNEVVKGKRNLKALRSLASGEFQPSRSSQALTKRKTRFQRLAAGFCGGTNLNVNAGQTRNSPNPSARLTTVIGLTKWKPPSLRGAATMAPFTPRGKRLSRLKAFINWLVP